MSEKEVYLTIRLTAIEENKEPESSLTDRQMEFHVSREARQKFSIDNTLFSLTGNIIIPNFHAVRILAQKMNEKLGVALHPERVIKAGRLNAMGLIDEILHYVCELYRKMIDKKIFYKAYESLAASIGPRAIDKLLLEFTKHYPPLSVWKDGVSPEKWLSGKSGEVLHKELALEELLMLRLANENPAFSPFNDLFDDTPLFFDKSYEDAMSHLDSFFDKQLKFGPENQSLTEMLRSPMKAFPFSLAGQLQYIRTRWGLILGEWLKRLLSALDFIKEEEKPYFPGPGPARVLVYEGLEHEYERFTPDKDWMPNVVMISKSVLVWLFQLSASYGRHIWRLDQIPDEELDNLSSRGFNALWLIGLWERSPASAIIKRKCGNSEAASSAYSLFNYEISQSLGGRNALENLRQRCNWRGIRLASDMVPNHTGIDSEWIRNRPDLFLSNPYPPFPGYTFTGENLSQSPDVGIWIEDHYYSREDAAVVFKRVNFNTGETNWIYHGNDGTNMPWNDTAQIDFLNPDAREEVIQQIIRVARDFPIIRFDAAMVLAKRHIRRLWYPEPGHGGAIPSRSEHSMSQDEFESRCPHEFWRELVDRCAIEAPDTLLLAEAFWMLEGYFVRTLGMHRVYNSAFMNMLKNEENANYRSTIKNTQEFDKNVLKRFVNFMNNPDEETAIIQFGSGDKYFGICTMMVTMPGLPMFGHGQVEGFSEKYGMEYSKPYNNEIPDSNLISRHEREIFPLARRRYLFSGIDHFLLFDLFMNNGKVNENVFAYSNGYDSERALVLYNNSYSRASGWIRESSAYSVKLSNGDKKLERKLISEALGLSAGSDKFLIMREQRSSLWFLRRSPEVCDNGLFVSLDGYQNQVFLDIAEIADGPLGQFEALCDLLNGAGVHDVDIAMQDLFLKDLYSSFMEMASPEFFGTIRSIAVSALSPGKNNHPDADSKKIEELLSVLRSTSLTFYTTAKAFLDGTSHYAAFPRPSLKSSDNNIENASQPDINDSLVKRSVDKLIESFEYLLNMISSCGKNTERPEMKFILNGLRSNPNAPETLACYIFIYNMRNLLIQENEDKKVNSTDTIALIDHWCLDRKLRESLQNAGVSGDEAWRNMTLLKTISANIDMLSDNPRDLYENCTKSDMLADATGLNTFDGVVWFNKERFELLAFYSSIAIGFRNYFSSEHKGKPDSAIKDNLKKTGIYLNTLINAAERSGYRFEDMGREME